MSKLTITFLIYMLILSDEINEAVKVFMEVKALFFIEVAANCLLLIIYFIYLIFI